jgi:hypothetical protein
MKIKKTLKILFSFFLKKIIKRYYDGLESILFFNRYNLDMMWIVTAPSAVKFPIERVNTMI